MLQTALTSLRNYQCSLQVFYTNQSSLKYFYYQRPIGDPSENYWSSIGRPTGLIRDRHMTDRRAKCLIKDPLKTNRTDWRPIEDQHGCLEIHRRLICLIGDPLVTDMPHWRTTLGKICIYHGSLMRHVGLRWVSDEACLSLVGHQSGMLVSDWSPIRHVGLR